MSAMAPTSPPISSATRPITVAVGRAVAGGPEGTGCPAWRARSGRAAGCGAGMPGLFFVRGGAVDGVPHPGRDRPEQGQGHDEDEALGAPELAVLQAEAARLEVADHGLDAPPEAVVEGAVDGRRLRHRDDPRL